MMIWLPLAILVAFSLYVRLAPTDPARWHVPVEGAADNDLPGGALRVLEDAPDRFERLHTLMLAQPRTDVVAGSVADGRVTYVTRSKWMGFPDFTTIEQSGAQIKLFARLRFGQSDLGVNRKRLQQVIGAL